MIRYLLFTVCLATLFNACQHNSKNQYVLLSGVITNTESDSIYIYNLDGIYKKVVPVFPDGHFNDTLPVLSGGHYFLVDGKTNIEFYSGAGDSLHISYDATDYLSSVKFTGSKDAVALNTYKYQSIDVWRQVVGDDVEAFYLSPKDTFLGKIHRMIHWQNSMLLEAHITDTLLTGREMRNNGYYFRAISDTYEKMNKITLTQAEKDAIIPLTYTNPTDFEYSRYYRYFIYNHYQDKAKEFAAHENTTQEDAFFKIADGIAKKPVKEYFLYNGTTAFLPKTEHIDSLYHTYIKLSADTLYQKTITEQYKNLTTVEDGKLSPLFKDFENYSGGTTSLTDFKGKYVYIDIWATWCGPCRQEIPYLKKLTADYKDKNIAFISISIDKWQDHDTWKKMVGDMELTGVQLYTKEGLNSHFIKTYQVNAIPRFILIGPDGKIIRTGAPSPSDNKLIELFNQYKI